MNVQNKERAAVIVGFLIKNPGSTTAEISRATGLMRGFILHALLNDGREYEGMFRVGEARDGENTYSVDPRKVQNQFRDLVLTVTH